MTKKYQWKISHCVFIAYLVVALFSPHVTGTETRILLTVYTCPDVNDTPVTLPVGGEVILKPSKSGQICTLSRIGDKNSYAAVGRSYDGMPWESVAGPYRTLEYTCDSNNACTVTVPSQQSSDQKFVLRTFQHNLSKRDEVARFLEQVTFGTSPQDLYNVNLSSDLDAFYSDWVYEQIYSTPETLHRAWWRSHTSSRYEKPGKEGKQLHPCSVGSRWRSTAFSSSDKGRDVFIQRIDNKYHLSVDGRIRTTMWNIKFKSGAEFELNGSATFKICISNEKFGHFAIKYREICESFEWGNPAINISGVNNPKILNIENTPASKYTLTELQRDDFDSKVLVFKDQIYLGVCSTFTTPISSSIFLQLPNGDHLIHDPTLELRSNIDTNPLRDGGGSLINETGGKAMCSNVPRTFLNEDNCLMSDIASSCSPSTHIDGSLRLNGSNLKTIFKQTGSPVYSVTNLRLSDDPSASSPCVYGSVSRWKQVTTCTQNIQPQTANIFRPLIRTSLTYNSNVIDVTFNDDTDCDQRDMMTVVMYIWVDGKCYTTVHPDEGNVYNFKSWANVGADSHPGNTSGKNPIRDFAENGQYNLVFPNSHPMWRWNQNKAKLDYIGRFYDEVEFVDLPANIRTDSLATALGLRSSLDTGKGVLVCGSRGEHQSANLASYSFQITRGPGLDAITDDEYSRQRRQVWTMIALQASDQLRQRMAWFLSQLLVISPSAVDPIYTENFLAYYDIFVKNAFGNYRDIIKEVAYSPLMADMLSYFESKSTEYSWKRYRMRQFADENFAREVMQLFTIGLYKLQENGTPVLDDEGKPIRTYTNSDITEFARIWTGFTRQSGRGNVEDRDPSKNSIDPMRIKISWRDQLPKMGLDGKYVGDGYVTCDDLPKDSFLRKGAKYRLLGKSKISDLQRLPVSGVTDASNISVTVLPQGSRLKTKLCGSFNDSLCTYKGVVELNSNLICTGLECDVSSIRVVEVANGVYYEYVPPPCVHLSFVYNGVKISKSRIDYNGESQCASRENNRVASGACCDTNNIAVHDTCKYTGEQTTLPVARLRCNSLGKSICNYSSIRNDSCGTCCNYSGYFWTESSCSSTAIVNSEGKVAIERFGSSKTNAEYESLTFFRVLWGDEGFPSISNSCAGCEMVGRYCRCGITVEETKVFSSLPSRENILYRLHVGGLKPELNNVASFQDEGWVKIYSTNPTNLFTKSTVFEIEDDFGRVLFLKNMESTVFLGEFSYSYRNPPSFYSVSPVAQDADYETDAAIDHYFYHKNVAPFIALRMLQRFGVSNPSPGYIARVSRAFKTGLFKTRTKTIGSGKYGDLAATVASVVLDTESRNPLIDLDQSSGSIREPLIKLISLMRNMQYQQTDGDLTYLHDLQNRIWQESHEMPSVFSFFLPEYSPPGALSGANLVSPEALLLPSSLELIDGMISLIKFGLSKCFGGFGNNEWCKNPSKGEYNEAAGRLFFSPNSSNSNIVVDELAALLTSGRMNSDSRKLLDEVYSSARDEAQGLLEVQQLAILSPAFHTTSVSEIYTTPKAEIMPARKSCQPYKAVVHLVLKGGADSYNMLVPHSECSSRNLFQQYRQLRGKVALNQSDLLQIDASASSQPCKKFGLHYSLPTVKSLYDDKNAIFLAGIGVLTKPVSKTNYLQNTKTELFAHNTMQNEIGKLDPFQDIIGTATIGRMADELKLSGFSVSTFSIDAPLTALQGKSDEVSKVGLSSKTGFRMFNPSELSESNDFITKSAFLMNGKDKDNNGVVSKSWSSSIYKSLQKNEELFWAQKKTKITQTFPQTDVGIKLLRSAQIIGSQECRGSDRDLIYIESGQWDHHSNLLRSFEYHATQLNDSLHVFVNELKALDKWDDTVIVISSEFGRSLTPNTGGGTDHGWSGIGIVLGGSIDGGRIVGNYPDDLSSSNPLDTGRGRFIPTMPFESIWNAVSEWIGVKQEASLNRILPNRLSFNNLLSQNEIFKNGASSNGSCEHSDAFVSCISESGPETWLDMTDDFLADDYFEESVVDGKINEANNATSIIVAVISVVGVFIVCIVIFVLRRRKRRSNKTFFSSKLVNHAKVAMSSLLASFGLLTQKQSTAEESDSDENTAGLETSMEIEHVAFHLLQYKSGNEVELNLCQN